jgi:hypothetical protein
LELASIGLPALRRRTWLAEERAHSPTVSGPQQIISRHQSADHSELMFQALIDQPRTVRFHPRQSTLADRRKNRIPRRSAPWSDNRLRSRRGGHPGALKRPSQVPGGLACTGSSECLGYGHERQDKDGFADFRAGRICTAFSEGNGSITGGRPRSTWPY